MPPLFYVITRATLALAGASELSIRLPEVIGFWVMCVCLFRFVSRRSPAVYGFLAMLFPLITEAYGYAYEARPYGLVLGFGGLALICWQSAAEGKRRQLSLAGMSLSLAAAVSCHYYAVFMFLPLAFGEAVRSLRLRRPDLPVWMAFGIGAAPLIGFLPLIRRAMEYSSIFWSKPEWMAIFKFYAFLLAPAVLPLMALLVLAAIYPAAGSLSPRHQKSHTAPPAHEVAAAFGFMSIPIIVITLSMLVTGSFTNRYALSAVIGFSVIVAFGVYSLLNDRAAIAAILMLCLCGAFLSVGGKSFIGLLTVREVQTQAGKFLQSEGAGDLPIAVSDQHAFMLLAHYGSPDIASRVVYLAGPDESMRYLGHNSLEKGLLDLRPWFPVRIEEYRGFIASKKRFLVYGSAGYFLNWLFSELVAADLRIEVLGRRDDTLLFLVSPKSESEPPANGNAGSAGR
ncbi:MAG: glycosyltransferase family 39 protein [Blastocatellia bacterium]